MTSGKTIREEPMSVKTDSLPALHPGMFLPLLGGLSVDVVEHGASFSTGNSSKISPRKRPAQESSKRFRLLGPMKAHLAKKWPA